MILQDNILMHVNWPYTLQPPYGKRITFIVTPDPSENVPIQSKSCSYTKITPYWPTSSPPLLPPPITSTHVPNQKTYVCSNTPTIHWNNWQYTRTPINSCSTRKITGTSLIIWQHRNKSTYWLSFHSVRHNTERGWNSHYPTSTRPPTCYKWLSLYCQSIHHHDSLQ